MGIEEFRRQIDAIDSQILELLNRRAEIVVRVGEEKAKGSIAYHSPQREEEIIGRLTRENQGPFPERAVKAVYREILSACLSLEQSLRVAYLGPQATFTHMACMKRFGLLAEHIPLRGIGEVFSEVEKGKADYGVVPVENSTEGVVSHTLDMFVDSDLKICGEILMEVSHHLLSRHGEMGQVNRIYSHPHAIAQSRKWLEANMPTVALLEVPSTAAAAELAAQDETAAAIASELAGRLYDLKMVAARIEDSPYNFTRFLVIGQQPCSVTGQDKTSILFTIRDRVGALYRMLEPFAQNKINLTKIESRPSRYRVWAYIFYVDFEGHADDAPVKAALERLGEGCLFLKVLGSYPKEPVRAKS
ncbi:MAG: prephenate dehydratase [candidate division NC10 bacterium]|nr:prephenate dehydratase [candidate division NC10 bacterium]